MQKKLLRKKYKQLRKSLTQEQIENKSIAIANNLLKLEIWDYNNYHIFLPIMQQNEINTQFIISILQGKDKNVILSKSNFKTLEMTNYLLTDNTRIVVNSYGIPEPESGIKIQTSAINLVFVPLLAYDLWGNRVGYGKGFYDILLSQCPTETVKIGLSFFKPEKEKIETNETDQALDFCVTPKTCIDFQ